MPKISVVIPLHNSEEFMDRSIRSVLEQTHDNFELILVDDASSDGTLARCYGYAEEDERIQVVPLKSNTGSGGARNAGLDVASGRYVAFLDSDDAWKPRKLEIQAGAMAAAGTALTYTDYASFTDCGRPLSRTKLDRQMSYGRLLVRPAIAGGSTVMYDRHAFPDVRFPNIAKSEDYAFFLELCRKAGGLWKAGGELAVIYVRSGSRSSNKIRQSMEIWKIMRDIEGMTLPRASFYFGGYVGHSLQRVLANRLRRSKLRP